MKPLNDSNSSLQGLSSDLDNIYNSYTSSNNNGSVDTLDSNLDQAPDPSRREFKSTRLIQHHNRLPEVHISSRLSSLNLQEDRDVTQSAPQTPNSASSFDFNTRDHHAVTNSSLNVLLDTPTTEAEFRDLVDTTPAPDSLENLPARDIGRVGDETGGEEWNDRGAAVKKVDEGRSKYRVIKRGVQDFEYGRSLGEGSYSTVVLATDKHTSVQYAVKILDKRHIIKEKKVKYVNIEKHALNRLSNRLGVISLYFTFQDKASLYFVLDYASNGELLTLIKKYNTLSEDCVRYFGAQILDAIKYMHDNGVIHRDIKPENILLDNKLRIQITDFGTARLLEKKNDESEDYPVDVRAKSFVGTAEYVSPELLESKYCGKPGDIWAFGCIIYQMIAGKPPFKATNEYLTFQKITKLQYAFSAGFPMVLRDFIKKILVLQPSKRSTIPQIQRHYFFESINWNDLDSIWNSSPPELGPYKMNAKSMLQVPPLGKLPSQGQLGGRSKKQTNGGSVNNTNGKRTVSESGSVNPASVAAFVLNKNTSDTDINDPETGSELGESAPISKTASRSSGNTSNDSRKPSAADYIPGTNILRPTINSRTVSRTSVSSKKPVKKQKPEIMEPSPISSLEIAWADYLTHPDERIMRIGPVIFSKQLTEYFEKKHKGLLHDTPLEYVNKLQGTKNRGNTSFLSQVVHGPSKGLRGSVTSLDENNNDADESNAITTFNDIEEVSNPTPAPNENNNNGKQSKSAKFKKFLLPNGKNSVSGDGADANNSTATRSNPEKFRTCTMMITTHGRALVFYRNEDASEYILIHEIKLNAPCVQFKEVVSTSSGKFQKALPTTSIFAIVSSITSFVFEVEKYEINQWTESLAKAKLNQYERENAATIEEEPVKPPAPPRPRKPNGLSPKSAGSSPRLADSPVFGSRPSPPEKPMPTERPTSPASTESKTRHKENMMAHKLRGTSTRRKPPPSIKSPTSTIDKSTGLGSPTAAHADGGMLHAAQLAVANNALHKPSDYRRSSFTKESTAKHSPVIVPSSSTNSKLVSSMNSKFLARSHRK